MTIDLASLQSRDGARRVFAGPVGGVVSSAGQEKEWTGCLLDDLRAFGIKTDWWTIAPQDADKWYQTVNKGEDFVMN